MLCEKIQEEREKNQITVRWPLSFKFIGFCLLLFALFLLISGKASASTSIDVSADKQGDFFFTQSGNTQYYYTITDEIDYLILYIRFDSPYCQNSSFTATLDNNTLTKRCDGFNNKYGYFYIDTSNMVDPFTSESMIVRINHPDNDSTGGEIHNIAIGSVSSLNTVSVSANSASSISRTKLLADPNFHILLALGGGISSNNLDSVSGGDLWPNQENSLADSLLIFGSSTPSNNNTLTAFTTSAFEKSLALFDFIGYSEIGVNFPSLSVDISLSWPDPIFCTYSYNCIADFSYTNMNFEETGTSTITWIIDDEGNDITATSTIDLTYPFQEFSLNISSTTAQNIGDIDTFSVSIGDIWESEGRIIWTEEEYPTSWIPDCTASTVCDFLTGTSTIYGSFPEVLACGLSVGGCYLLKPSEGVLDLFRRNANQAGGVYRNLGVIEEQIYGLASSTGPATSTFYIDLREWGGRNILIAESDELNEILNEDIREYLFTILRFVFYFCFAVSLFVQISIMTRNKES